MSGIIRTGMAGWVYEPWRKTFYPDGLVQKQELAWASERVSTIEINATFYANQRVSSFANWANQSAPGIVFSIKGPKFITHQLKLKNAAAPLANFFASGVLRLGEKLGPFVWQLPGNLKYDRSRLEDFFALLPRTPADASSLAAANDGRLKDEPYTDSAGVARIRHALEVRNDSYANPEFIDLLRASNVAMVIADTADWPWQDLTSDFAYLRLQGPPGGDGYGEADIATWAARLAKWTNGEVPGDGDHLTPAVADGIERDVFGYFVHEDKLHAPHNAMALKRATEE